MPAPNRTKPHSLHVRLSTDQRTTLANLAANTGWNETSAAGFLIQAGCLALANTATTAQQLDQMRALALAASKCHYRTGRPARAR